MGPKSLWDQSVPAARRIACRSCDGVLSGFAPGRNTVLVSQQNFIASSWRDEIRCIGSRPARRLYPRAAARGSPWIRPEDRSGNRGSLRVAPAFSGSNQRWRIAVGLAAFVFFVIPWMAVAVWLSLRPTSARLGAPSAPWRPLTDYPPPPQRD